MRKMRLIAVIGLALFSVCHPYQTCGQDKNNGKDGPPTPVTIIDNSVRQSEQDAAPQKPPETHVGIVYYSQLATLFVTVLTLVAVWKQALETAKSAEAAHSSAEAAKQSAIAQMDAHRAWILVKVRRESHETHTVVNAIMTGVFCEVEVVGNTPARILSEKYRCRAVPRVKDAIGLTPELERVPVFLPENEVRRNPIFLAPGDKSPRHMEVEYPDGSGDPVAKINTMEWVLCAYGRVEYEDAFKRKAVTQFCAICHPRHGSVALGNGAEVKFGGFAMDGPDGYNYNT